MEEEYATSQADKADGDETEENECQEQSEQKIFEEQFVGAFPLYSYVLDLASLCITSYRGPCAGLPELAAKTAIVS